MDRRLRPGDGLGLHLALAQAQDLHAPRVVAAVPLDVGLAVLPHALAEAGGELAAVVLGDLRHGAELGLRAGVLEEDRPAAHGEDEGFPRERDVPGADEVLAPGHAALLVLEPVRAAPAVALESDDLADEVPRPGDLAVRFEGVDARPEGGEVDPALARGGGAEDRVPAVDLADHGARLPVEHVVEAGHRPEVEGVADDGGGGDVVAVGGPSAGSELPDDLEGGGIEAERDARAVHRVDQPAGDGGGGEDGIRKGRGRDEAQGRGETAAGRVARSAGVELELGPVFLRARGAADRGGQEGGEDGVRSGRGHGSSPPDGVHYRVRRPFVKPRLKVPFPRLRTGGWPASHREGSCGKR